ncbi:two-component system, response regulator YesN [Paenibacillus sp. cl141a]|uniref:response regulator transcription factor n=1 Tax=Paenibacillus sp. cl141a TaxID=1761877 RepID=UPI0008BA4800|nr:response regulator [Paenibacillus sp. cl141a]SEL94733.1 two-component system, response regulator YesN [Paenibacillus sp. cl141a]
MWKVVLVEDEIFVREEIRDAVQWEQEDFVVIGEASNGVEAMKLIEEQEPDLVITDIRMPFMNGIELLQAVREGGRKIRFVMLTCMNEFEYVRQALVGGASDYILKLSMSEEDMHRILHKIRRELEEEQVFQLEKASETCKYWLQAGWKQLLEEAEGPLRTLGGRGFHPVWQRYFSTVTVCVLLQDLEEAECRVRNKLMENKTSRWLISSFTRLGIVTILIWSDQKADWIGEVAASGQFHRTLWLDDSTDLNQDLVKAWKEGIQRLEQDWYSPSTASLPSCNRLHIAKISWDEESEILRAFEQFRSSDCLQMVKRVWNAMENEGFSVPSVKATALRLNEAFARISQQEPQDIDKLISSPKHAELLNILNETLQKYLTSSHRINRIRSDHPEINRLLDYIYHHYNQNITLKEMAALTHMDEQYLSGLFKKKIGESPIRFVQSVRVKQAEFYLRQTNLTVSEIGKKVGFANDNYFFRIFKRWTGVTPNDFRNK